MSDLTTRGMNPEIGGVWQGKIGVCAFKRDRVLFARQKVRLFRGADGVSVFLTLLSA
jgi:hypothetical protein